MEELLPMLLASAAIAVPIIRENDNAHASTFLINFPLTIFFSSLPLKNKFLSLLIIARYRALFKIFLINMIKTVKIKKNGGKI